MEKKYQVFVSSTFEDLKEERAEVIKALLEMDCIPCGMEFFPAANEDSWSYIEKLIKECDYYIVIVAGRYGALTDEGISYTQKEYECAVKTVFQQSHLCMLHLKSCRPRRRKRMLYARRNWMIS